MGISDSLFFVYQNLNKSFVNLEISKALNILIIQMNCRVENHIITLFLPLITIPMIKLIYGMKDKDEEGFIKAMQDM